MQGSGETVLIQGHCVRIQLLSGSVSLNPESSVYCNKIFCPSLLQTATSDALAKYFCAPELRSQGEEVTEKTMPCRIYACRIPPTSYPSSAVLELICEQLQMLALQMCLTFIASWYAPETLRRGFIILQTRKLRLRCYVLCPRSSSMWKNLDLNTDVKFRDIEIDQLLACLID